MSLYASIDVGSNTIRLLIASYENNRLSPVRHERAITRLAAGIGSAGRLNGASMDASIGALAEFKRIIDGYNIDGMVAAGTSALREASNAADFIDTVNKSLGIRIDVISGQMEAEITAMGVLGSFKEEFPSSVVADIGGGSTELIFALGMEAVHKETMALGVVKLLEKHIKSDPPVEKELDSLKSATDDAATLAASRMRGLIRPDTVFIGTAGTPTTLAAMDLGLRQYDRERVHGHKIKIERLRGMYGELKALSVAQRAALKGIEPGRADLIIPGIVLKISLMDKLGFDSLVVSDSGLLEGLLICRARRKGGILR